MEQRFWRMVNGYRANVLRAAIVLLLVVGTWNGFAQPRRTVPLTPLYPPPAVTAANEIRIIELQGLVEVFPSGATGWTAAQTNQVLHPSDRVHSGGNSRLALRWSDQSIVSFGASTELEILPPNSADEQAGLHLVRGIISFFHRDQPGRIRVITRGAVAGVEGTEFALAVDQADNSTLSVIDGRVRFGNEHAMLVLTNGQQAVTALGQAPARTAGFIANNLLQWCFYYPAVLVPEELQLTAAEQQSLADSLAAYRSGDLLAALAKYPAAASAGSDREKIYHAALLLAVGEVAESETILATVTSQSGRPAALGTALRQMIAAVKRQPSVTAAPPQLASELLAASYFEQSRAVRETSLEKALQLARQATVVAPGSGFAWARVAELEFSFGHARTALKALDKSMALAPRNAQALALKGFILAAQDQPKKARDWFDRAIATDAALGNAWLGRGIVRIHLRDEVGGREDLLVAAALEPQRAELRSYLGKAYALAGDDARAGKELALAKKLDPHDPTAWLYSALLNQQGNRINEAILDVEKSQSLNDNRSVYRSQLLLDQDSAVRAANLAWMYKDAGLFDLSMREAGRAVSSDYANYSAHYFLANSYDQLRDPNWANLRYETPANVEFFLANLLAPTSAGILSTLTAEQPYAKLFDQNRLGFVSDTTYLSRGAWMERGGQFGTSDKLSYSVEGSYQVDPGQRPNEGLTNRDLQVYIKYQLTPHDSIFFNLEQIKIDEGRVNEYYKPPSSAYAYHTSESQDPNLYGGFHHEWSPGVHTLFLASSGKATTSLLASNGLSWAAIQNKGVYKDVAAVGANAYDTISPKEDSAELQQIWETGNHTTIVGARYFEGNLTFGNIEWYPTTAEGYEMLGNLPPGKLPSPKKYPFAIVNQYVADHFQHETIYGYHDWQVLDSLKLSAGASYDYLQQPAVVNTIPPSSMERAQAQTSPKAGLIWNPRQDTTFRAAYTRSLSGFINDSSIRLEPSEVAGFNQAYRSIAPDSVAGDTSGSRLDTVDVALEQKFDTGTYLAVSGEILYSRLLKYVGGFYFNTSDPIQEFPVPRPLQQFLDYRERTLTFTADQLLGQQWSVGTRYRISQADLDMNYVQLPANIHSLSSDPPFKARQNLESVLQTVTLHANWNHPSGLFSEWDLNWYRQDNLNFSPAEPGDDFWQLNARVGWRFWHRRAELSAGILNLTDQSYRLEPLNLYNEMAQSRTYFVRLLVTF